MSNEDGDGPPGRCDEDLECNSWQEATLSQRDGGLLFLMSYLVNEFSHRHFVE